MTKPQIEKVPLSKLQSHPRNPRLVVREDVVASIAAQLEATGSFSEMHAPIVRPVNSHYEIVSGHHRAAGALKAGLKTIPCWVKDMSDEEAFMALVLSNAQGELKPLEIGMHALHAVPPQQGKKGGGLKAYAEAIGQKLPNVSVYRTGAEVLESVGTSYVNITSLLDCAQHLAAIHGADHVCWPVLVKHLVAGEWSVADTKNWVDKAKAFDVAEEWHTWLPLAEVVDRFLTTKEFSPQTVDKLQAKADEILLYIDELASKEERASEFKAWLDAGRGTYSWDLRKLIEWHEQLKASITTARSHWKLGNWREYVDSLEDESISLILTDPPYGMDYQSDYRLDRRDERKHEAIENDGAVDAPGEVTAALAALMPKLSENAHVLCFCHWSNEPEMRAAVKAAGLELRGSLIWNKNNTGMGDPTTTFAPKHERILHVVKGSPILYERLPDVLDEDRVSSERHPTEKPTKLLRRLIEATTVKGQLVADPFGGVASTLVAAKDCERNYWGCELSAEYHVAGAERLGT